MRRGRRPFQFSAVVTVCSEAPTVCNALSLYAETASLQCTDTSVSISEEGVTGLRILRCAAYASSAPPFRTLQAQVLAGMAMKLAVRLPRYVKGCPLMKGQLY